MHPENWPIKGKPATNIIIQLALAGAVVAAFVAFPAPMAIGLMLWIALAGGRATIRQLRNEWRRP